MVSAKVSLSESSGIVAPRRAAVENTMKKGRSARGRGWCARGWKRGTRREGLVVVKIGSWGGQTHTHTHTHTHSEKGGREMQAKYADRTPPMSRHVVSRPVIRKVPPMTVNRLENSNEDVPRVYLGRLVYSTIAPDPSGRMISRVRSAVLFLDPPVSRLFLSINFVYLRSGFLRSRTSWPSSFLLKLIYSGFPANVFRKNPAPFINSVCVYIQITPIAHTEC